MARSAERKAEAAAKFAEKALARARGVYAIYLFGSVAKGMAEERSDVDVLVVVTSLTDDLRNLLAESAFETFLETSESVEYVAMDLDEFLRLRESSPFLYEVEKWGKLLHMDCGEAVERAKSLVQLADEYHESAERCLEAGSLRLAVDALHNASELLVKALIISKEKPLPSTHGGFIHVFGELFVRAKIARKEILRDLHRALELRNRARYEPYAEVKASDVEFLQALYRELRSLAAQLLRPKS